MNEKHWKKRLDEIFDDPDKKKTQADVINAVYAEVVSDWDSVEKLDGYPKCGKALREEIFKRCIEFDKVHHPDVMAGGAWLNCGFSGLDSSNLGPWEVSTEGLVVHRKMAKAA